MTPPILLYPNLAERKRLVTKTHAHVRHIRITRIGAQTACDTHAGGRILQGTICATIPDPRTKPGPAPWQTWIWTAVAHPVCSFWHWDGDCEWHHTATFWRWNAIVLFMHDGANNAFAGHKLDRITLNPEHEILTPIESIALFMHSCLGALATGCEDILKTDMTADEPPLPTDVVRGMWEHCEGGLCFVEGIALKAGSNDETDRLLIFRELYGTFGIRWITIAEFTKPVTTPAGIVPRFTLKTRCPS